MSAWQEYLMKKYDQSDGCIDNVRCTQTKIAFIMKNEKRNCKL